MSEVHDLCVPHWGKQKGVTVLASNTGRCQDWRQLLGRVGTQQNAVQAIGRQTKVM